MEAQPESIRKTLLEQFHQLVQEHHKIVAIQNPQVVLATRGWPREEKKALKSTKRDPSAFELGDKKKRKRAKVSSTSILNKGTLAKEPEEEEEEIPESPLDFSKATKTELPENTRLTSEETHVQVSAF